MEMSGEDKRHEHYEHHHHLKREHHLGSGITTDEDASGYGCSQCFNRNQETALK